MSSGVMAWAKNHEGWPMSGIEELVGRQIELCELRRRLQPRGEGPRSPPASGAGWGPSLLISRQCGSGGSSLAALVGARLDWRVFDREIVEEVARSAHVRRRLIESVDDRVRHGWSEWRRRLVEGEGVGRESYLAHLREVILALGQHGYVVIVGRGARYLLPPESVVSVRVVAPLDERVRRVSVRDAISEERARHRVQQTDAERAAFIREVFGREVETPEEYDLVVDTGESGLEAAANRVLAKLEEKLNVRCTTTPCTPSSKT